MTGTVTGATAYQRYAGGLARDVPKLFDDVEPVPVRNWE